MEQQIERTPEQDLEEVRALYERARLLANSSSPVVADAAALIWALTYNVLRQIDTTDGLPGPDGLYAART
jgi:hypothetical protein